MKNFKKAFDDTFKIKAITLNVTNECNLRCSYCFEKNKCSSYMDTMTAEKILRFTYDRFIETRDNVNEKFNISFFGGEPLLNFDLIQDIVSKNLDANYYITTNFVAVSDEMLQVFQDYDFGILVSIDGIKEIHDKNRCNSYDRVVANIKRAIEYGLHLNLEARITITPEDVSHLFEATKNVFELGIDNIAPCMVYDMPWSEDTYKEYERQIRMIYEWALSIYNDPNNKRNLQVKCVDEYIELCYGMQLDTSPCGFYNNMHLSFGPDGEFGPCHQIHTNYKNQQELLYGNINDEVINFDNIGRVLVAKHKESEKCDKCNYNTFCRRGCPVENLKTTGKLYEPTENVCRTIDIMYRVSKEYQEKILNGINLRTSRLNALKINLMLHELSMKIRKAWNSNVDFEQFEADFEKLSEDFQNSAHLINDQVRASIANTLGLIRIAVIDDTRAKIEAMGKVFQTMFDLENTEKYNRRCEFKKENSKKKKRRRK